MKTLQQINSSLEAFEQKYKLPVIGIEQGSEAWLKVKLGVISASNAHKVVAKKDSETRLTYMSELVAQIATGESEEFNSKYLDWGKQFEAAARSTYEFSTNQTIQLVPFVFKDETHREGFSPDGIVSEKRIVEIKCPFNAANYIKFVTESKIKSEYKWQYQFGFRVTGADEYDFVQYHPHMKTKPQHVLSVERDDEMQKTFDDAIPQFIEDMDKMLAKIGIKFGEQWS